MSAADAAASCQAQPQALPDGHSVTSYLKEGLGAWPGWGRQFVKSTAYVTWYSEGYVSVAVYLSFFVGLSTAWPSNSMLWRSGSGSAAMKLLCITCFHIIIFPCALFYTYSRKPFIRKTQPAPLPVASPLHQESCDHDFSSSPHLPWCSPKLQSLHARQQRGCDCILSWCRSGDSCTHYARNHDERYFWPYNCRKNETGVSLRLCGWDQNPPWCQQNFSLGITSEVGNGAHYAVNNGVRGDDFVLWL